MMADSYSTSPPPTAQKMSRYRSQRQAHQASVDDTPIPDLPQQSVQREGNGIDDTFARSKSRYRKRNVSGELRSATSQDQERIDIVQRPKTTGAVASPVKQVWPPQLQGQTPTHSPAPYQAQPQPQPHQRHDLDTDSD